MGGQHVHPSSQLPSVSIADEVQGLLERCFDVGDVHHVVFYPISLLLREWVRYYAKVHLGNCCSLCHGSISKVPHPNSRIMCAKACDTQMFCIICS